MGLACLRGMASLDSSPNNCFMTTLLHQVTRIAAYGLILKDEQILLCRLSRTLTHDAGYWTLPGGGLEFGEDPATAMRREVHEETGLIVKAGAIAGIDSFTTHEPKRAFHSLRIIYHTAVVGGVLRPEANGSTDLCAWWTLEQTHHLPLVDLVKTGLKLAFHSVVSR